MDSIKWTVVFIIVATFIVSPQIRTLSLNNKSHPPIAKKIPVDVSVHEKKRIDDYGWLRNKTSKDVLDHLNAENDYTQSKMRHTEKLQNRLFLEMKRRLKENDSTAPYKWKDYYYYSRTEKGKQYSIYARKKESLNAQEQVVLDLNDYDQQYDYVYLGAYKVSPNQEYLAYTLDLDGSENYTLRVKYIKNNALINDELTGLSESVEWANDNQTLFYVTRDESARPYRVWRHQLGQSQSKDELIYEETDDAYHLELKRSKSGEYLFLILESNITTECWYLNRNTPDQAFSLIQKRQVGVEYEPMHQGNRFLIMTNDHSLNYKLISAPVEEPQIENWEDVLPHRESVKLEYVESFKDFIAVFEREEGNIHATIYHADFSNSYRIELPESIYDIAPGHNLEYDTPILRFYLSSFSMPYSYYDYDVKEKSLTLIKRDPVLGGYNPENYESIRLYAPTQDGKKVPLSIFYKKGLNLKGNNPVFLYGYGSYGSTYDPSFSSRRISLVDRGVVYVQAHIRGSAFLGRQWYEDGKLSNKQNTFSDFIASAEYLIHEKVTSSNQLTIYGGSAGGLLIGAVMNQRPDLFKAAIADVPFVDVVNTMLDESIPLTVIEYDEWGNPNKKDDYKHMIAYSPYDNVKPQDYPSTLVIAGLNDPRVGYWEPAKWVAKLRELKSDQNTLLLKTHMGAGHFSSSGRYDYLKDVAFYYAFALDQMGLNK